jgi:hypothetical protein
VPAAGSGLRGAVAGGAPLGHDGPMRRVAWQRIGGGLLLPLACGLVACGLVACGAGGAGPGAVSLPAEPVTELVGELHLHQFPLGSHAWAAFVQSAVPVANVRDDQLVQLDTAPTAVEGPCTLYRRPTCQPDCAADSYCAAPDRCRPIPEVIYVNGGPLRVGGSRLHDPIRLDFTSGDTGYASDPPPGDAQLFAGGELLTVSGGSGPDQLAGRLRAPLAVQVIRPSLQPPFHLPLPGQGPLEIAWNAGDAALVVIYATASRADGDYGLIRCVVPDVGQAVIPTSLLARMPGPPRDNRLEVERDNEQILKTVTPGRGLYAHAAYSAWANGSD